MNAYPVDYQLDMLQVRTFGVQTGLVMPVFRQGKRELFLSNTDNDIHNIMDYNDKVIYPDKIRSTCIISATILSSRTWR